MRLARSGFPAIILRPSIVYGPYSRWCTGTIERLRKDQVALIDGGAGICNTTYVDNLIDAIFLALGADGAIGQSISITDGELVTWADFIGAHVAMMRPRRALPEISSAEVLAHHRSKPGLLRSSWRRTREVLVSHELRQMLNSIPIFDRLLQRLWYWMQTLSEEQKALLRARLMGSASDLPKDRHRVVPDLETWATQSGNVRFRIDKAKQTLGYTPRIPFTEGIGLTEQWLSWANYV